MSSVCVCATFLCWFGLKLNNILKWCQIVLTFGIFLPCDVLSQFRLFFLSLCLFVCLFACFLLGSTTLSKAWSRSTYLIQLVFMVTTEMSYLFVNLG